MKQNVPGSPSQVWSRPGDKTLKAPFSLWPFGAAWVQIPPPAPNHLCCLYHCFRFKNKSVTEIMLKILYIKR